ncbi:MAG: family 16 glycosylhydrolase [Byssovorax sp.]
MKLYLASLALVMMTAGCVGNVDNDAQEGAGDTEELGTAASALGGNFFDPLDGHDTSRWAKSNWANGDWMFNCGWRPDHIYHTGGSMFLKLTDMDSGGKPFSSGEYKTTNLYGYGKAETRMIATKQSGIVSSFFTYTGPSDGNPWDEIDIEFLGKNTNVVQFNYFKNGVGNHEHVHNLGFDAAAAPHNYAIVWMSNRIIWQVDGKEVYTVWGNSSTLPSAPMHIVMNMWNATVVDNWTGPFSYQGVRTARYDWAQYFANATY